MCKHHGDAHVAQEARSQLKALVLPKTADAKVVQAIGRTFFALLAKVATNPSCTGLIEPIPITMQYEYWLDMLKRSGPCGHSVVALLGTQFQTVMNHQMDTLVSWTSSNFHNAAAMHADVPVYTPPDKKQKVQQHQSNRDHRDHRDNRDQRVLAPAAQTQAAGPSQDNSQPVNGVCHACHKPGHFAPTCPDIAAKAAWTAQRFNRGSAHRGSAGNLGRGSGRGRGGYRGGGRSGHPASGQ